MINSQLRSCGPGSLKSVAGMWSLVCCVIGVVSVSAAVDYDVVVYGSTPAGIAAATAAGMLGMKVRSAATVSKSAKEAAAAFSPVSLPPPTHIAL
jgi:hypothetical protein